MHDGESATELSTLGERYDLVRELGRGGVAVVYLALDRETGQYVAVKVIRRHLLEESDVVERFAREARLATVLEHPNVVRTYEVLSLADGTLALVMQFVSGGTLRDALHECAPFSYAETVHVLTDVGEALRYAHRRGLVHRDVKPENIFLDESTDRALLSDFGIARSTEGDTRYTRTGAFIGTPTYMSPEHIAGTSIDGRSDIYSLGVVGWEMLSGERPWAGETLYGVIYRQMHDPLPRLTNFRSDIPSALLYAIEGALDKHRDTRWASADEFLAELADLPHAPPRTSRLTSSGDAMAGLPRPEVITASVPPSHDDEMIAPAPARRATSLDFDLERPIVIGPQQLLLPPARPSSFRRGLVVVVPALAVAVALAVGGARLMRVARAPEPPDRTLRSSATGAIATPTGAAPIVDSSITDSTADVAAAMGDDFATAAAPAPADSPGGAPTVSEPRAAAAAMAPDSHIDSIAACASSAASAQKICFDALLADEDVRLNQSYRALIAGLERIAGRREPRAVSELREEQRAWLEERDSTCVRRLRPSEGPLWAPARAACLGRAADVRAHELEERLARLTNP